MTARHAILRSILAGSLLLTAAPGLAQDGNGTLTISRQNRTIAVTATEHVLTHADAATVHIGFVMYGPDQDAAYTAGSNASSAIMAALRGAGVPANCIQSETQGLAETPPYTLQQVSAGERLSHAFTVQQSWTVRTPATQAATILDLAVKAGANQSGAIDWTLRDPNTAQSAAAAKAIQRARSQAQAMASGLGVQLGALLYASNRVEAPPVRPLAGMEDRVPAARSKIAKPLAINPQEIDTSATVYAVFALE